MNVNLMGPRMIILAVAVLVILALVGLLYVRKRRCTTADLKQQFRPDDEGAVAKEIVETMGIDSDSCAKIKALGFEASKQIKMYGERFEIVSDPFKEGNCIGVCATSGSNPEIHTVLLPIAILLGIADRVLKRPA